MLATHRALRGAHDEAGRRGGDDCGLHVSTLSNTRAAVRSRYGSVARAARARCSVSARSIVQERMSEVERERERERERELQRESSGAIARRRSRCSGGRAPPQLGTGARGARDFVPQTGGSSRPPCAPRPASGYGEHWASGGTRSFLHAFVSHLTLSFRPHAVIQSSAQRCEESPARADAGEQSRQRATGWREGQPASCRGGRPSRRPSSTSARAVVVAFVPAASRRGAAHAGDHVDAGAGRTHPCAAAAALFLPSAHRTA